MLFSSPGRNQPPKMHVRRGDKVVVISGQYKSNEPREVLKVEADGRVIVQGVNLRWKHQRQGQDSPESRRVQVEAPIDALDRIHKVKAALSVPVIASLNGAPDPG